MSYLLGCETEVSYMLQFAAQQACCYILLQLCSSPALQHLEGLICAVLNSIGLLHVVIPACFAVWVSVPMP